MSNISPLAIIEDGAVIGKNVSIAPYAFVSAKASIGDVQLSLDVLVFMEKLLLVKIIEFFHMPLSVQIPKI